MKSVGSSRTISVRSTTRAPSVHRKDDLRGLPVRPVCRPGRRSQLHASSGTTGKPTVVGYTAQDIATWSELMALARVRRRASATSCATPMGTASSPAGTHGARAPRRHGLPMSGGATERQILPSRLARACLRHASYAPTDRRSRGKPGRDPQVEPAIGISAEPGAKRCARDPGASGLRRSTFTASRKSWGRGSPPGAKRRGRAARLGDHFLFE
jgi:hypothetical protein